MATKEKYQLQNEDLILLLDQAIALVPGTDVEISMLQRYGSDTWKARMVEIRELLVDLRKRAQGVSL